MKLISFFDETLERVVVNDVQYYNVLSLYNYLVCYNKKIFICDEVIIVPFYILNNQVFELYDYELDVLHMDTNEYILMKTGKKSIKSVDGKLIDKYSKCFISLKYGSVHINLLLEYIEYILFSDEIKCRIPKILGAFEKKNLFLELY